MTALRRVGVDFPDAGPRPREIADHKLVFTIDGATNFDLASAGHIVDAHFVFVGSGKLRECWTSRKDGTPATTQATCT